MDAAWKASGGKGFRPLGWKPAEEAAAPEVADLATAIEKQAATPSAEAAKVAEQQAFGDAERQAVAKAAEDSGQAAKDRAWKASGRAGLPPSGWDPTPAEVAAAEAAVAKAAPEVAAEAAPAAVRAAAPAARDTAAAEAKLAAAEKKLADLHAQTHYRAPRGVAGEIATRPSDRDPSCADEPNMSVPHGHGRRPVRGTADTTGRWADAKKAKARCTTGQIGALLPATRSDGWPQRNRADVFGGRRGRARRPDAPQRGGSSSTSG
jgi:hypothetical protein